MKTGCNISCINGVMCYVECIGDCVRWRNFYLIRKFDSRAGHSLSDSLAQWNHQVRVLNRAYKAVGACTLPQSDTAG